MARPLPVNMLLAGLGGVLLVSGIGGKSIGDVLKGEFGKLEVKNPNIGSEQEGAGATNTAAEGAFSASPVTFSQSTVAPSVSAPGRGIGTAPPPGNALYLNKKRELEEFLHRPLTRKENEELRDLERKGEL